MVWHTAKHIAKVSSLSYSKTVYEGLIECLSLMNALQLVFSWSFKLSNMLYKFKQTLPVRRALVVQMSSFGIHTLSFAVVVVKILALKKRMRGLLLYYSQFALILVLSLIHI